MKAIGLRRPKQPFCEWLAEKVEREHVEDCATIGGLLYYACGKESPYDVKKRVALMRKIKRKLDERFADPMQWDGRSWRWYHKIYEEREAAKRPRRKGER